MELAFDGLDAYPLMRTFYRKEHDMSATDTHAAQHDAGTADQRYARPMIALHWMIAIAIIAMLCIGFYMESLPRGVPFKSTLINFHKSLGLTAFMLVLLRIWVRSTYSRPPLPPM